MRSRGEKFGGLNSQSIRDADKHIEGDVRGAALKGSEMSRAHVHAVREGDLASACLLAQLPHPQAHGSAVGRLRRSRLATGVGHTRRLRDRQSLAQAMYCR